MIYPVFLPHAGCPFQCVYCNQRVVVSHDPRQSGILEFVESALRAYSNQIRKSGRTGEIAFFGGTFSALPFALIESILGGLVRAHQVQRRQDEIGLRAEDAVRIIVEPEPAVLGVPFTMPKEVPGTQVPLGR